MKKTSITVVPLGPGSPELLTVHAVQLLRSGQRLFLRTSRHPVSSWLTNQGISWTSLDSIYEESADFDALNDSIASALIEEAGTGPVLYGVPDPLNDRTVPALKKKAENASIPFHLSPGVSMMDACLDSDALPHETGSVRLTSAIDFISSFYDPNASVLITEVDSQLLAGEVKLKLGEMLEDEAPVYFFPPSQETFRKVLPLPLMQLDRQKKYDQTAAVYIPGSAYARRKHFVFDDLRRIMTRLRAQDGCPWDRVQTHASLRPYMIEEAWEAVEAIDADQMDHLSDELGDVLLQVVFHASIAESFDEFTMIDVISHICLKMLHRHPHLFGSPNAAETGGTSGKTDDWEKLKRAETGSRTIGESLNDVSTALPSLTYAIKVNKKLAQLQAAAQSPDQVAAQIREAASSLLSADGSALNHGEMGNLLIRCMELCRQMGADGEVLLHGAVNRLKRQYQKAEKTILSEKKEPEALTYQQLNDYLKQAEDESKSNE